MEYDAFAMAVQAKACSLSATVVDFGCMVFVFALRGVKARIITAHTAGGKLFDVNAERT